MDNVLSKDSSERCKSRPSTNSRSGKLFFAGKAESIDVLQEKYRSILPDNASIEVAGKSVSISMEVPKVDPLSMSFSDEKEKVKQALQCLSIFEKLASANGGI